MTHCTSQPSSTNRIAPEAEQWLPVLHVAGEVYGEMLFELSRRPVESGGLLLGPIGSNAITGFHFDDSALCSGATYTPDHVTLNRLLKERWIPSGIDFKGFAHSHPSGCAWLSAGDIRYIRRLLSKNDDMDVCAAPIVVAAQYQLCPLVVTRDRPDVAQRAELVLF